MKMKYVKLFESFLNESYKENPLFSHVITHDEALKLLDADEDDLAPGEPGSSDEECAEFVKKVEGMTLGKYAEWRWPDEPQKQFEIAIKALNIKS